MVERIGVSIAARESPQSLPFFGPLLLFDLEDLPKTLKRLRQNQNRPFPGTIAAPLSTVSDSSISISSTSPDIQRFFYLTEQKDVFFQKQNGSLKNALQVW